VSQLRLTILLGLQQSGREKTFSEILGEAAISYTKTQLLDAANALESLGLIDSVTYQLPVEIRAELTSYGREFLSSIQNEGERRDHFHPKK
jgi:hypothetical protein